MRCRLNHRCAVAGNAITRGQYRHQCPDFVGTAHIHDAFDNNGCGLYLPCIWNRKTPQRRNVIYVFLVDVCKFRKTVTARITVITWPVGLRSDFTKAIIVGNLRSSLTLPPSSRNCRSVNPALSTTPSSCEPSLSVNAAIDSGRSRRKNWRHQTHVTDELHDFTIQQLHWRHAFIEVPTLR